MSGYKRATISISQEEFDRLREAERKLSTVPDVPPGFYQEIGRQSLQAFQSNIDQIRSRQAAFDKMVSGLDHSIRDLERNTNQAMAAFETSLMAETQNYAGRLWNYFDQVIADHAVRFEETIAANHRYYQQELAQTSRQIRRLEADGQRKVEMAAMWLDAAEQFCGFIKQNYAYQKFAPGHVEWLEAQLDQAHQNLGVGLAEAVILSAQQLYTALSDLRMELERLHNEWCLLYQSTWEALTFLESQVHASRSLPAIDLDGNEISLEIDVDYWAKGRLTMLVRDLQAIRANLTDPQQEPETEQLDRWLYVDLPSYDQALADIVFDARTTALNSQLRINIAELVIRALQEQGFSLEASNYDQEDMRSAYLARLCSFEGNEVFVHVNPVGQELGENELHLQSLDREERTEHELQQRWNEVDRSLAAYGLMVSGFTRLDPNTSRPAAQRNRRPPLAVPNPLRRQSFLNSG